MIGSETTLPIGLFDSGIGGLTVLRQLLTHLPDESFIYLGDTARLPYGTKSAQTIRRYAKQMASILIQRGVKCLLIACNSATAAALPYLQQQFPAVPIIGVVKAGAVAAVQASRKQRIMVLATEATRESGIYQRTIAGIQPKAQVLVQACGLFVALAEEGWISGDVAEKVAAHYLRPVLQKAGAVDCVLLGCTHFPALLAPIRAVLQGRATVINSARVAAEALATLLATHQLQAPSGNVPQVQFLVTDLPERFSRIGPIFLEQDIAPHAVQWVDVQRIAEREELVSG